MESIRCSTCEKRQGTCLCSGCKKYFCMQDFKSHRNSLGNEMDSVISDRDSVQDKLNKSSDNLAAENHLLLKITEWEEEIVRKVRETANLVRQQVLNLQQAKQEEIKNQLNKMSKELIEMKETEDFVEPDLSRLRLHIQQLDQDLNSLAQPNGIRLYTTESNIINWNRLIYIEETSKSTNNRSSSINTKGKKLARMVADPRDMESLIWDDDTILNNIPTKRLSIATLTKRPSKRETANSSANSTDSTDGEFWRLNDLLAEQERRTRPLRSIEQERHSPNSVLNTLDYIQSDEEW